MKNKSEINSSWWFVENFSWICVVLALAFTTSVSADWIQVNKQDRIITIKATGTVDSNDFVSIGAPPSTRWRSRIQEIVAEGSVVRPGQTVVVFEGSRTDDRIRELQGEIAVSESQVESDKEKELQAVRQEALDLANLKANTEKAVRKAELPPGVVPGVEYQTLVEQRRLAETLYERALIRKTLSDKEKVARELWQQNNIARLKVRLEEAQRALASFTVRAPQAGVAVVGTGWDGQKFVAGSNASQGFSVVKIVNDKELLIKADIPENMAAVLEVGQRATITTESTGTAELEGDVFTIGSTVRRKSQNSLEKVISFTVKLREDYSDLLRIGVSVEVNVEIDEIPSQLAVPREALVYRKGEPGVLTPGLSIAGMVFGSNWQKVTLGPATRDDSFGDALIIEDGIQEGDTVRRL